MYHEELKEIIELVLKGNVERYVLMEYILNNFDCEKIYDSNDKVVTDVFFTLKHYASGEEEISNKEWSYFLDCLEGKCEYNIEEKMRIIAKPLNLRD